MVRASQLTHDLARDPFRLIHLVRGAHECDERAKLVFRVEDLAFSVLVFRDDLVRCPEDQLSRAVIALQANRPGGGKVPLEFEDVSDVSPPPPIDRLVVIADNAEVAMLSGQ